MRAKKLPNLVLLSLYNFNFSGINCHLFKYGLRLLYISSKHWPVLVRTICHTIIEFPQRNRSPGLVSLFPDDSTTLLCSILHLTRILTICFFISARNTVDKSLKPTILKLPLSATSILTLFPNVYTGLL